MKNTKTFRDIGIFILMVVFDIAIIQVFRHFTPKILCLRLGFIFAVLTISIYLYYVITKPVSPIKAGLILSIVSFIVALSESYIIHVIIEKGEYKALYLLPGSFALALPILLAFVYKRRSRI